MPVPSLVLPTVGVRASFLTGMAEFMAEGRGAPEDRTMIGAEIRGFSATWSTPEGFAAYVGALRADARPETPRPAGHVPATTLWWLEGAEYLGRLAIRHVLNAKLRETGGNIGYDVRPSARRQGHATAMLRAALPIAHSLGLEKVLVTCDLENVASRKVIEANGGVFEDERQGKRRYWLATA
jgi:predicted acetyltransferase